MKILLVRDLPMLSIRTANVLNRNGYIYAVSVLEDQSKFFDNSSFSLSLSELNLKEIQKGIQYMQGHPSSVIYVSPEKRHLSPTLLNVMLPESLNGKGKALFKDIYGQLKENVQLTEEYLPVRAFNALSREGLTDLSALLNVDYTFLEQIRSMGSRSVEDVKTLLKKSLVWQPASEKIVQKDWVTGASNLLADAILEKIHFPESDLTQFLHPYFQKLLLEDPALVAGISKEDSLEMRLDHLKDLLLQQPSIRDAAAEYAGMLPAGTFEPADLEKFSQQVLALFGKYSKQVMEQASHKIDIIDGKIYTKLPTLQEWIQTLSGREKELIQGRLSGSTLEQLGQQNGLTRERIRQLCSKTMAKMPVITVDRYQRWYQTYNLNDAQLKSLFLLSDMEVEYLKQKYEPGNREINQMQTDPAMNPVLNDRLHQILLTDSIWINGHYIKKSKFLLMKELIKAETESKSCTITEAESIYNNYLQTHGLANDPKLQITNPHSLENRMSTDPYFIRSSERMVRYYPVLNVDIENLVSRLDLSRFKNVMISSKKLFDENPELMKEYDIRNEGELHNLLNRTQSIWNRSRKCPVVFGRMPTISFGTVNIKEQIKEMIDLLSPISVHDFALAFQEKYGVKTASLLANHGSILNLYNYDGILDTKSKSDLSPVAMKTLESYLVKDFYILEDIHRFLSQRFGKKEAENLSGPVLNRLGYRKYSSFILKSKWQSAKEYFLSLFSGMSPVDISSFDPRLKQSRTFSAFKYNAVYSQEILEIGQDIFLNREAFQSKFPQVTETSLKSFRSAVQKAGSNKPFFTFYSLIEEGFDHPLLHQNIPEWTLNTFIRDSENINYTRFSGTFVFSYLISPITIYDVVTEVQKQKNLITASQIVMAIKNEFGIEARLEKITSVLELKKEESHLD